MTKLKRIALWLLAAATVLTCIGAAACKKDEGNNPVIMKTGKTEIRKFDFAYLYGSHKQYEYVAAGAIKMSEYFNIVVKDLAKYAVTLDKAKSMGFELTEEDEAKIKADFEAQIEYTEKMLDERVDASITDEAERKAKRDELLETDTGYDMATYRECLENTLRNKALVDKLFEKETEGVEPTEEEILNYIELQTNTESQYGFATFAANYEKFIAGEGKAFFFVPDNCFTVDQIFFGYDTTVDADGNITSSDNTAALEKAAALDAKLAGGIANDELRRLVGEDNDDENMLDERFRSYGYLVHSSLTGKYSDAFNFGAYKANGERTAPGKKLGDNPEYEVFETATGKKVVKVFDEDGIRYIFVNRRYPKGNVSYEKADTDPIWQAGYEGAKQTARLALYEQKVDEWYRNQKVTVYYDKFKSDFMPTNE